MSSCPRSFLFVPANRPDRFEKAYQSGAHVVVADLEDAVSPDEKDAAREDLVAWLDAGGKIAVRLNAVSTTWFAADADLCTHPGVSAVVLPKTESVDSLHTLANAGAGKIYPLIETAVGFGSLAAVCAGPNVQRLLFGTLDFQADLRIHGDDDELLFFRSQMVLASRIAGLDPPVDGISTNLDDPIRIREAALRSRNLGFGGKLCIHPKQVGPVNEGFLPSPEELSWAERVLRAAKANPDGAFALDGKMVDRPVLLRAQAIVAEVHR